jgi:hypothetical protein
LSRPNAEERISNFFAGKNDERICNVGGELDDRVFSLVSMRRGTVPNLTNYMYETYITLVTVSNPRKKKSK